MGSLKTRLLESLSIYRPALLPRVDDPMHVRLRRIPGWGRGLPKLLHAFRSSNLELVTTERIVEVPFVHANLKVATGAAILDLGCNHSHFAIQLASLGYRVTGVDLDHYALTHPNLEFRRGDLLDLDIAPESFDAAVAISTVEHCGLGAYGGRQDPAGDLAVVRAVHRILRPGGRFLLTVPCGRAGRVPGPAAYRVYDPPALERLVSGFDVEHAEYFRGTDRRGWAPIDPETLAGLGSTEKGFVEGVACLALVKRSSSAGADGERPEDAARDVRPR
jgi:SAM-dependent methyltransferase